MAILEIKQGFNQGATFRLGHRTLTIGRDARNMIQVIDDKVSRRHAMIRWDGERYLIIDLQSQNGTFVNGKQIQETTLEVDDLVCVGDTEMGVSAPWQIVEDGVLAGKVVDRRIVAAETKAAPILKAQSIQKSIEAGETIEVDAYHAARDLLIHKSIYHLGRIVAQKKGREAILERAAQSIIEFVSPDRLLFLRIDEAGKGHHLLARFAEGLSTEKSRVKPHKSALVDALKSGKPVCTNRLSGEQGTLAIDSVLTVPVSGEERPVGVLYIDSFSDSPQSFIDDDQDFVVRIAQVIRPAFE